jgi:O-antigen ligase
MHVAGAQPLVPQGTTAVACLVIAGFGVLLGLTSTVELGLTVAWFDDQRILSIAALGAAVAAALIGERGRGASNGDRVDALVVSVLALGLVSALRASRPEIAMLDWAVYAAMGIVVLRMRVRPDAGAERAAAIFCTAVAAAYSVGVVARYISAIATNTPLGLDTLLVGFSNPRFPAQLEALTIPFLPLAWRLASSRWLRYLVALVAALWWMCFFGSGSRTAWAAVLVACVVLATTGRVSRAWLTWQAIASIAGLCLHLLLFVGLPYLAGWETSIEGSRFAQTGSIEARLALWKIALEDVIRSPVLGVGPMHFAFETNGEGAHPHNFWLQLASEWGLPACLILASGAALLLARLYAFVCGRQPKSDEASLSVCVLAAFVVWCVGTQADGFMVVPTSQLASTVVLMLAVGIATARPIGTKIPGTGMGCKVVAALALTAFAMLPFTHFGRPAEREAVWRAQHPTAILWPRFWQQGWIGPDQDPTARR